MTPEMMSKLRRSLDGWINEKFSEDMDYFYSKMQEDFPWFDALNEDRKAALIELALVMGYRNFCSFDDILFSLEINDFEHAALGLLDEKVSRFTNGRATRLASIIKSGVYAISVP